MSCGSFGVGLELRRSRPICTSIVRSKGAGLAAARLLEQEVARQHAPGVAREGASRSNSPLVSATSSPCGVDQAARRRVELPAGEAQRAARAAVRGAGGAAAAGAGCDAPQHRLDAREQLAQVEGLGDVVVGADLEPDDLVDRVAAAGDDDQAAVPVFAQLRARSRSRPRRAGPRSSSTSAGGSAAISAISAAPVVQLRDPEALRLRGSWRAARVMSTSSSRTAMCCGFTRKGAGHRRIAARTAYQRLSVAASADRPCDARPPGRAPLIWSSSSEPARSIIAVAIARVGASMIPDARRLATPTLSRPRNSSSRRRPVDLRPVQRRFGSQRELAESSLRIGGLHCAACPV